MTAAPPPSPPLPDRPVLPIFDEKTGLPKRRVRLAETLYLREDVALAEQLIREIEVLEAIQQNLAHRIRSAREQLKRLSAH